MKGVPKAVLDTNVFISAFVLRKKFKGILILSPAAFLEYLIPD